MNQEKINKIYRLSTSGLKMPYEQLVLHLTNFENLLMELRSETPFLFSYLRDTLLRIVEAKKTVEKGADIKNVHTLIYRLLNIILERLKFFENWDLVNNETIRLISEGIIKADSIKPFVRKADIEYQNFYELQNENLRERAEKAENINTSKKSIPIALKKNLPHSFRKSYAVNLIETVMGILDVSENEVKTRTWLDIGCGVGLISNAVDTKIYSNNNWEIIGCDLQESRIKMAKKKATKGKKYFCNNAFDVIANLKKTGKTIDIISMFEFCEHFSDPAQLIRSVSEQDVKVIVIGTPLEQKLNAPFDQSPDPAHLWGFSTQSMKSIIEHNTKMSVISSTENRVGTYFQGLDWLSIVIAQTSIKEKIHGYFTRK